MYNQRNNMNYYFTQDRKLAMKRVREVYIGLDR